MQHSIEYGPCKMCVMTSPHILLSAKPVGHGSGLLQGHTACAVIYGPQGSRAGQMRLLQHAISCSAGLFSSRNQPVRSPLKISIIEPLAQKKGQWVPISGGERGAEKWGRMWC